MNNALLSAPHCLARIACVSLVGIALASQPAWAQQEDATNTPSNKMEVQSQLDPTFQSKISDDSAYICALVEHKYAQDAKRALTPGASAQPNARRFVKAEEPTPAPAQPVPFGSAGAQFDYVPNFSWFRSHAGRRYNAPFALVPRDLPKEMLYFIFKESSGNYDHGFGAGDGYNALGAFQIDRNYGLANFFMMVSNYDPAKFYMLAAVGEKYNWDFKTYPVWDNNATEHPQYAKFTEFGRDLNWAWHQAYAADPATFSALQNDYIYKAYYASKTGIKRIMLYYGIDLTARSNQLKSLVWGMANLFGTGGGVDQLKQGHVWGVSRFIEKAGINGSMSDVDIITRLCDSVVNNCKELLPKSDRYWQGYINRYNSEKAHYLSQLTIPAGEVHRVYNPKTGEHLFITSNSDKEYYLVRGWKNEGKAWVAPNQSSQPVYRMVNPYSGDHMFTVSKEEADTMVSNGWQVQYMPFYSADSTGVPVYRLFNPYATFATHHFTLNTQERDYLVSIGWKDEGIAWYASSK